MTGHTSSGTGIDSAYTLTRDQIDRHQRDGHILLRGVASAGEVEHFRGRLREVVEAVATR
jgi:hypothetical protein